MLGDRVLDLVCGLPRRQTYEFAVQRDLRVPMPDGVVLLADRYVPRGIVRGPVVLVRTPYGRGGMAEWLLCRPLARRGIQVVVQSVRGTFGSGGEFRPFRQERADGAATLDWLRAQPWCDGTVGMTGPSYVGHTQWALAPYADPPLAAICPAVAAASCRPSFYPGGGFSLGNLLSWSALIGTQERRSFGGRLPDPLGRRRLRRSMWSLPLRTADQAAIGTSVSFWREVTAHCAVGDTFWEPIDHGVALRSMTTPTSMVTGWHDLFLAGQLHDFRQLVADGRDVRITVGPWAHTDPGLVRASVADQVSWLSAHLLGARIEQPRAPVRLYLQRAGRWLNCDRWPPQDVRPRRLYLHPGNRLRWQSPTVGWAPDRIRYDPADPTPTVGGPMLVGKAKQRDNRRVEARADVLVYTSDPVPRDLDVVGELSATIHLHVEPGYADVFVRLCDVDKQGRSRNVCDGLVRLDGAGSGTRAAEVTLTPTAYRFRRGHRLRVQVSGGAFPRFARNHGTGAPLDEAVAMTPVTMRVLRDGDHPSHLELPVLAG